MRFTRLDDWLAWQERLHPREIDLGLDRIAAVLRRLGLGRPAPCVISVGGTNGKGSVVVLLEAILRAAGYRVGAYTSPHLFRYNERIRVDGQPLTDDQLLTLFEAVDRARDGISLTYFEFGTAAALSAFRQHQVDIALLEVGLGGRLDAVNAVDADAAAVVSVGVDHTDYLGADRETIGLEKAGIFRPATPAICGDPEPPASLLAHAAHIDARLRLVGRDFSWEAVDERWSWHGTGRTLEGLPRPALAGRAQLANAATALELLAAVAPCCPVTRDAVVRGLAEARLPGRCQWLPGPVERVLDVGHNAQAAAALVDELRSRPCRGRRRTVFGMLSNKPVAEVAEVLAGETDIWYLGGLTGSRSLTAEALAERIAGRAGDAPVVRSADIRGAYRRALADAQPGDRVLVTGSFLTVAEALDTRL